MTPSYQTARTSRTSRTAREEGIADWRERLDDRDVLGVVRKISARAGATVYRFDPRAADDVDSWCLTAAAVFARSYAGNTTPDEFRAALYTVLWRAVVVGAHREALYGDSGTERGQHERGLHSLDHPAGDGLTIGGLIPDNRDPLAILLERERLEELLDRAEHAPPRPDDGLCDEPMCTRPRGSARGLCTAHWQRERDLEKPPCSSPGCERFATRRGLCQPCWTRDRDNDPSAPRCAHPECPKAVLKNGLCGAHNAARTRAQKKENTE